LSSGFLQLLSLAIQQAVPRIADGRGVHPISLIVPAGGFIGLIELFQGTARPHYPEADYGRPTILPRFNLWTVILNYGSAKIAFLDLLLDLLVHQGNGFWTQEIYYHALNCGVRIPPTAGSASGVLPNPVGYDRVYVQVAGDSGVPGEWLVSGASHGGCGTYWFRFVSTGPFYVEVGAKPRVSRASARFFLDWVRERMGQIKLADPGQQEEVLKYHREAEQFWKEKIAQANAE
jgi:hypothetical protein